MTRWDGAEYQARFDRLAAAGTDVHGEAAFVSAFAPATVLDAGSRLYDACTSCHATYAVDPITSSR